MALGTCYSQPAVNTQLFTVRKHDNVIVSTEDVRLILARAAKILNDEFLIADQPNNGKGKAGKGGKGNGKDQGNNKSPQAGPIQMEFRLMGEVGKMKTIDETLLQATYTATARRAIRDSERNGRFVTPAVDSVMFSANRSEGLQINIVAAIIQPCPELVLFSPTVRQQVSTTSEYPWLGCSEVGGSVSVLRLVRRKQDVTIYDEWITGEALLWAHEIGHLFGLRHLSSEWRLPPLRGGFSWLMMQPYRPHSTRLLPQEVDVIAGGVARTLPVFFPLTFSFDFATAVPSDGGWYIAFNAASLRLAKPDYFRH